MRSSQDRKLLIRRGAVVLLKELIGESIRNKISNQGGALTAHFSSSVLSDCPHSHRFLLAVCVISIAFFAYSFSVGLAPNMVLGVNRTCVLSTLLISKV